MKKLLKEYNFNSDMQYFEMIVTSVINGQRTQAKTQFNAMPKGYKKDFIRAIYGGAWTSGLSQTDKDMFLNEL